MNAKDNQYQLENNAIMEMLLENRFYNLYRMPIDAQNENFGFIELNITATCNQECSYCYLVKYGDKIYPKDIRSPKTILKNTKMLFDYFVENKFNPRRWDLFSGEIWGTKFGDDFLTLMLEYIQAGKFTPKLVIIPSNCSFVFDDAVRKKIDYFIAEYKKYKVKLCFSISIDGMPIELENRPSKMKDINEKKKLQESYDLLFDWAYKHDFAFHPMVAASTIEKWCENYDWWVKMLKRHHRTPATHLMTLEVRNDEWTEDKIISYLRFLDHMINGEFKNSYSSIKESFVNSICGCPNVYCCGKNGYMPFYLTEEDRDFSCTLKDCLIVRMGDLSIGPCHRTHYPEFIYGKYKVEDDKITGVEANNIVLMNRIYSMKTPAHLVCDSCSIAKFCIKGCMGAQFEANGEPLYPCDTVCELFKARAIYLYLKYKKTFVFDYARKENAYDDRIVTTFVKCIENLKEEYTSWRKWFKIAESIVSEIK